MKTANSSRFMTYDSGCAVTLAQIWLIALSRMLLTVGSEAPSGLSLAISRAWATLAASLTDTAVADVLPTWRLWPILLARELRKGKSSTGRLGEDSDLKGR